MLRLLWFGLCVLFWLSLFCAAWPVALVLLVGVLFVLPTVESRRCNSSQMSTSATKRSA